MPGREYSTFTQTENKDNIIARLESELSNVQAKKQRRLKHYLNTAWKKRDWIARMPEMMPLTIGLQLYWERM